MIWCVSGCYSTQKITLLVITGSSYKVEKLTKEYQEEATCGFINPTAGQQDTQLSILFIFSHHFE
jgi:hypothetical protein